MGAGDTIPLGRRTLQVIAVRYDDDQPTVLIVRTCPFERLAPRHGAA
jgi:hypothetical protein